MRILIHDYAGHPFPVPLSRELARRGHEVTHAFAGNLLTPRGILERRDGDPAGLSFCEVPMSPEYPALKYNFLKRRSVEVAYGRELARLVDRLRPDIVVSGQTPTEPQWRMMRTASSLRIPVITWLQDFYSLAVDHLARKRFPVLGVLAGRWYQYLDRKCFRSSEGIVAITEDFVPLLARFGVPAERVTVIPNWAALDELPLRPRRNSWSQSCGLDDCKVFLYAGTLAMKHNPECLLRLARRFRGDPVVRVVVVSEGPGADYLQTRRQREALANLLLLPFQPFEFFADVLATADVLVALLEANAGLFSVPSKVLSYHCAGRAILGSMPAGNLASRIMVKQGSGLCVDPDNIDGFVEQAERLNQDLALREGLARRARAYAEAEFTIETIADRFERVIARALKAGADS